MNTSDWEVVYGEDAAVADWMWKTIGNSTPFYGYVAIGLRRKSTGEWLVGVLYDRFSSRECQMHIASKIGARWATEENIRRAFTYAFVDLKRERVTGETPVSNTQARKYNEHLGFIQEGVKRAAADNGEDVIVYGMLRDECRWIGGFEK